MAIIDNRKGGAMNHEELREQIAEVVVSPKGTLGEATDAILSRIAEAVKQIPNTGGGYNEFANGFEACRQSILELLEGK